MQMLFLHLNVWLVQGIPEIVVEGRGKKKNYYWLSLTHEDMPAQMKDSYMY